MRVVTNYTTAFTFENPADEMAYISLMLKAKPVRQQFDANNHVSGITINANERNSVEIKDVPLIEESESDTINFELETNAKTETPNIQQIINDEIKAQESAA
ncbi:MAG: hypothetical protein OXE99_07695 [Cellvibrionales bacterium]|nr:hypothetical protein [Cellvibrionales bacterium]